MAGSFPARAGWLALVVLAGCQGGSVRVGLTPELVVVPEQIELGPVAPGETVEAEFTLLNPGRGLLQNLAATAEEEGVEVLLPDDQLDLGSALVGTLRVTVDDTGDRAGRVLFRGVLDNPSAELTWTAQGAVAGIEAAPAEVDFGTLVPRADAVQRIILRSVGTAPLTITDLTLSGEDAALCSASAEDGLPATLPTDAALLVELSCRPVDATPLSATLTVGSSDSSQPELAIPIGSELNGRGSAPIIWPLRPGTEPLVLASGQTWTWRAQVLDSETPAQDLRVDLDFAPDGPGWLLTPDASGIVEHTLVAEGVGDQLLIAEVWDPDGGESAIEQQLEVIDCPFERWAIEEHFGAHYESSLFELRGTAAISPAGLSLVEGAGQQGAVRFERAIDPDRLEASFEFAFDGDASDAAIGFAWGPQAGDLGALPGPLAGLGGGQAHGITLDADGSLSLWDLASGSEVASTTVPPETSGVVSVSVAAGQVQVLVDGSPALDESVIRYETDGSMTISASSESEARVSLSLWTFASGCL